MNRGRYIAYRVAWAGVASLVVTVVLFVVATSIGDLTDTLGGAESPPFPDAEAEFWDESDPLYVQYLDWLASLVTLDWGESLRYGEPVTDLVVERGKITAAYLVPSVVLGTALATLFGYVAAAREGGLLDGSVRTSTYLVLAVPNFLVAATLGRYLEKRSFSPGDEGYALNEVILSGSNVFWIGVAVAILSTHVAAVQLRQVRAQSSEYLAAEFTRMLHAKGLGPLGVARHVLRAAIVPLTSLFVAEVAGLLLVSVFVIEAVLRIPGLGFITWNALNFNDAPLVLNVTFLVALTLIFASLLEDIIAVTLDPRLDDG
jgi:peptide/nickel transport system permease protein